MGIPQLTFLRFIAASAVVIFHFGRDVPSLTWGSAFWPYANTAVSFFFVLSGFILAHVYGTRGVGSLRDFYVARFARIAPVYWVALLVVTAYTAYKQSLDSNATLLNVAMLQAWIPGYALTLNSPGWSLSVELFFYLFFPWLLKSLKNLQSTTTLVFIMIMVWLTNQVVHASLINIPDFQASKPGHDFTFYNPLTHAATFISGVIGGMIFDAHRRTFQRFATILIVTSVCTFSLFFVWSGSIVRFHHNGLLTPLFLLLLWGLGSARKSSFAHLLSARSLVLLGESSYGVYILQFPILILYTPLAVRFQLGADEKFWSYFLILVTVSILSFLMIEKPLRKRINAAFKDAH